MRRRRGTYTNRQARVCAVHICGRTVSGWRIESFGAVDTSPSQDIARSTAEPIRLASQPCRISLEACPKCAYSLQGLPGEHRCPECGFAYDDLSFVLTGIVRGTTNMSIPRKLLYALLVISGWFLFEALFIAIFSAWWTAAAIGGVAWAGLAAFLIISRRGDRRGVTSFAFTAEGFFQCCKKAEGVLTMEEAVTHWHEAQLAKVERKTPTYYRVRIGCGPLPRNRLRQTYLDMGIRCHTETADWIAEVLTARIEAARNRRSGR